MDFANAALLIAAVLGIAQGVKKLIFGSNPDRIVVGIVYGSSALGVFLVGASVWAHEQVLGGHTLDHLNVASKLVVVLFVGGGSSALWETFTTIKNIGQNQIQPPDPRGVVGPLSK